MISRRHAESYLRKNHQYQIVLACGRMVSARAETQNDTAFLLQKTREAAISGQPHTGLFVFVHFRARPAGGAACAPAAAARSAGGSPLHTAPDAEKQHQCNEREQHIIQNMHVKTILQSDTPRRRQSTPRRTVKAQPRAWPSRNEALSESSRPRRCRAYTAT